MGSEMTQTISKTSPNTSRATDNESTQFVSFRVGDEEYAVNILQVQEINRVSEITRVPQAPTYVEGVINLRGTVLPVVNLRTRFNLEATASGKDTRVMVVDLNGKVLGRIVDEVCEVLRLESDSIEPAPDIVTGIGTEYITGVARLEEKLVIMLDLHKVVDFDRVVSLDT